MPKPKEISNRPRDPIAQQLRALSDRLEALADEFSVAPRDSKDFAYRSTTGLAILSLHPPRLGRGYRARGRTEREARCRHENEERLRTVEGEKR